MVEQHIHLIAQQWHTCRCYSLCHYVRPVWESATVRKYHLWQSTWHTGSWCCALTKLFSHLFDKDAAPHIIRLCQARALKPWPSPDPGTSLSPLISPRGGVSGDHGAQSAWSLRLCWGKPVENTPSRYADSLMGAREEVKAKKCTLQTFQCSSRNSIFSQQRFIHIYTCPNTDRKVVEKKSWNCRGKLYVNAIK